VRLAVPLLAAACGSSASPTAAARGGALFESAALSPSSLNIFTCATCHDAAAPDPTSRFIRPVKPGAPLAGATLRPSFWGGQENDLLRSVDDCRTSFMDASAPLSPAEANAEELYAYLVTLEPGAPDAVPFTVVQTVADVPRGDSGHGASLFVETCVACHGTMHAGSGRLATRIPVLPDETLATHASYSAADQRLIFIEKIRHGGFLGYGGDMPPFSLETLSDSDLSDLLEGLGVLGL
jgi:thiosulfate dehydrogenase